MDIYYFPSLGKDGFAHIRNLFAANAQDAADWDRYSRGTG